jgi:hypothetical protein
MSVASETIIQALEDMIQFEEIATANLTDVNRYDFSCFGSEGQRRIRQLLSELREDNDDHQRFIRAIMSRLEGKK